MTGLDYLQSTSQATHATIDVDAQSAILAYWAFSKAAPVILALCANSSNFGGRFTSIACIREFFWDAAILDSRRVGIGFEARSLDDYFNKIAELPISRVVRGSSTIHFEENISFKSFLNRGGATGGRSGCGDAQRIYSSPEFVRDDLAMHESTVWFNSRLRFGNSTLEIRAMDTQQIDKAMLPVAIVRGLSYRIAEMDELLHAFGNDDAREARRSAVHLGLKGSYGPYQIADLASVLLDFAEEGLALAGDSSYLTLFHRCRDLLEQPFGVFSRIHSHRPLLSPFMHFMEETSNQVSVKVGR